MRLVINRSKTIALAANEADDEVDVCCTEETADDRRKKTLKDLQNGRPPAGFGTMLAATGEIKYQGDRQGVVYRLPGW